MPHNINVWKQRSICLDKYHALSDTVPLSYNKLSPENSYNTMLYVSVLMINAENIFSIKSKFMSGRMLNNPARKK